MSRIGIIGGSGLYQMEGIKKIKKVRVTTPFGDPSDKIIIGKVEGKEVVFLPRHGVGHRLLPSEINYRANIYAMKKLGVSKIISVSACGSLKEELKPLHYVIPLQLLDRTNQARKMTFFGDGIVAHIGFADPICRDLAAALYETVKECKIKVHLGGTYINIEGPAFSTLAESNLYRSWGLDIIGMTNVAEARLAREAEICYATLSAVTDYDCWREKGQTVSTEEILCNFFKNIEKTKRILKAAIGRISQESSCSCSDALRHAIITPEKLIPAKTKKKLSIIIGKYIK